MIRLTIFHVMTILVLIWPGQILAAELTMEQEFQHLKENFIELRDILALKKSRLETLELKVMQHDLLEEKIAQLERKIIRLEAKDKQCEILAEKVSQLDIVLEKQGQTSHQLQNGKNSIIMSRTCREVRDGDPSLTSGMYWIDPDGQGIGDGPIYVYCDMATGSTSVLHDSEGPMNVGHCTDPGCYSRAINYSASQRQIGALAELSKECHQSIQYDCNYAPLEFNGVTYSWWNDKEGNAKFFWTGSDSSVHTCQCGIDGNCIDPNAKCNCDATLPIPQVDSGVITDKEILPISRLNFGRTPLETSSGIHTLGRYECTGKVAIVGMPTSCEDLWRIGHSLSGLYLVLEGEIVKNVYCNFTKLPSDAGFQSLIGYAEVKPKPTYFGIPTSCANLKATGHTSSGLYSVMGTAKVESIFCDFTKLPSDASFQKWIGYNDVKSAAAYFYVQRSNAHFNQTKTPIPFDVEKLNAGGAFNLNSGKFTTPVKGKYFFTASGIPDFPASSSARQNMDIGLYKNGGLMGAAHQLMQIFMATSFRNQRTVRVLMNMDHWLPYFNQ
uniref:C1q domain-containing protein n=1 Tax=Daphnia galeata TaxID=27404 RepID=A0A8J2WPK0_9CRUS|nr:unnamed protein product [Daphnia galeata]